LDATKVKAIRCFLEETQEVFARRLGVSTQTLSAIENNHRSITDKMRSKLIRIEESFSEDFYIFLDRFRKSQ